MPPATEAKLDGPSSHRESLESLRDSIQPLVESIDTLIAQINYGGGQGLISWSVKYYWRHATTNERFSGPISLPVTLCSYPTVTVFLISSYPHPNLQLRLPSMKM